MTSHYKVRGAGSPLVFLHCWMGNSSFYDEQVARFSSEYRCVTLDFPGHGGSGEAGSYTVGGFAETAAGLMRELEIDEAVFVGHSLGGMVGLQVALEHPELVEGLVLMDTSSNISGFRLQKMIGKTVGTSGRFATKHAKAVVAGLAATHPLSSWESRKTTGRECCKVSNDVMVSVIRSIGEFDVSGRLGEITQPALIIVGNADALADVRHSRVMERGISDARIEVIKGAGHMALFEKPEAVNDSIESFLNGIYAVA